MTNDSLLEAIKVMPTPPCDACLWAREATTKYAIEIHSDQRVLT